IKTEVFVIRCRHSVDLPLKNISRRNFDKPLFIEYSRIETKLQYIRLVLIQRHLQDVLRTNSAVPPNLKSLLPYFFFVFKVATFFMYFLYTLLGKRTQFSKQCIQKIHKNVTNTIKD